MKILAILTALLLAPMPAYANTWKPAHGDKLEFDVLRDGGPLGFHTVTFSRTGDTLTVETDVELKVTFGPITFFEYVHDVTEKYTGGKLVWVGSRTKNEGKWKTLSAQAVGGGLKVASEAFNGTLSGAVIPSTHWNQEEMKQATMFSTETGEMLPMKVTDRGMERVKVGGTTIEARRYDVVSELTASFWYDAKGRWVKCAFEAEGSKIEYVLPMKVTDRGMERVKVGGATIEARRYDVVSELTASFWYDAKGRWVKCAFEAEGSKIEYVLRKLPD